MLAEKPPQRSTYEHALRIIGRFLDAEPAYDVAIVEGPDGFTVRSHPVRHRSNDRLTEFDWARLQYIAVFNLAGREAGRKSQRHRGIQPSLPTGHEDFLRALGHELDLLEATGVSVDELPEGFRVSYVVGSLQAQEGFEKRDRLYGAEEIDRILHEAQNRRHSNGGI